MADELKIGRHIEHVLTDLGYKLKEDSWNSEGRRTYSNSEDADRDLLKDIEAVLREYDWTKHPNILRAFTNAKLGELLEIEIGAPEIDGHLLHHKTAYAER
ncbi:hypothetical protein [Bradyrhizobium guangdongense]